VSETAVGSDLEDRILAHLNKVTGLTSFEIARALGIPHPEGACIKGALRRLEAHGDVLSLQAPRSAGDRRPCTRWWAND
jgi:predicted ArsR family transcriptional regulator